MLAYTSNTRPLSAVSDGRFDYNVAATKSADTNQIFFLLPAPDLQATAVATSCCVHGIPVLPIRNFRPFRSRINQLHTVCNTARW